MAADRICRIYWGAGLENALDFAWPVAATEARTKRTLRDGSRLESQGAAPLAWVTGRDYRLTFKAQYFGADRYSGALGLQAFLDWAAEGSNTFTLVPDQLGAPSFQVDGCFLVAPFLDPGGVLEVGGEQTVELEVAHPTVDLAMAWRGLMLRVLPTGDGFFSGAVNTAFTGGKLSQALPNDPFVRSTSGAYWTSAGKVAFASAGVTRDAHYPLGYGSALKTILLEGAGQNSCLQSQAWATTPWAYNLVTATNNSAAAPDGTTTASKMLPNNTGAPGNPFFAQTVTVTSGEFLAVSGYFKANGYSAIVFRCSDAGSTVGFQMSVDLLTGSVGTIHAGFGAGVMSGFAVVPLAGGWYWVGMWGAINGGITAASAPFVYVYPNIATANAQSAYTADGVSSVLGWGGQVERNGTSAGYIPPTSYMPSAAGVGTRAVDDLRFPFPWPQQAMFAYIKLVDLGVMSMGAATGFMAFTSNAQNAYPIFQIDAIGGAAQWRVIHGEYPGGANVQALVTMGSNYNDVHEALMVLNADGSVQVIGSRNGGAPVASSVSAALAFTGIFGYNRTFNAWSGQGNSFAAAMMSLAGFTFGGGPSDRARGLVDFRIGPLSFAGATRNTMAAARVS